MFGRGDAAIFIESLLKTNVRDVFVYKNVPGWDYALMIPNPSINDGRYVAFTLNNQPLWILDIIPQPMDHVVPQKMWTPPNQSDWRRYVEQASLCMPVFFIQNDGSIGLPLVRALSGQRALLRCGDTPASLGGGHSTQIRIAVSTSLSPSFPGLGFRLKTWLHRSGLGTDRGNARYRSGTIRGNAMKLRWDDSRGSLLALSIDLSRYGLFVLRLYRTYDELMHSPITYVGRSRNPRPG